MVATPGNALNISSTGLVKFDGTATFSGVTVTQHDVLVGASSNGITSVASSATSGVPLISQGASSDPAFGTAVVAGGGTGAVTLTGVLTGNGTSAVTASTVTQHGVLIGGASNAVASTSVGSTGQVLQANSSADPTYSTATYPSTATGTGTILRADGTNWTATTATYPATTAANTFLTSTSANVVTTATFVGKTTFTPVLNFGGATTGITYSVQNGFYQRIGNVVNFGIEIILTSKGSATGVATITGLPLSSASLDLEFPIITVSLTLTATNLYAYYQLPSGSSTITLYQNTIAGGQSTIQDTNFGNSSQIFITSFYFV